MGNAVSDQDDHGNSVATDRTIRENLACAYRPVASMGWDDLIFTHLSARVPGPEIISCSIPTIAGSRRSLPLRW